MTLPNHEDAEATFQDWLQSTALSGKRWNFTDKSEFTEDARSPLYSIDWKAGDWIPFGASTTGSRLVRISILVRVLGGGRPDWEVAGDELAALQAALFPRPIMSIPMKAWPAGTTKPGHISWLRCNRARRLANGIGHVQDLTITY